ncbi:hypothetical protein BMETH_50018671928514, partial [methanotrophic bacterial endosymbiont of Bathymodiolus sp.]
LAAIAKYNFFHLKAYYLLS